VDRRDAHFVGNRCALKFEFEFRLASIRNDLFSGSALLWCQAPLQCLLQAMRRLVVRRLVVRRLVVRRDWYFSKADFSKCHSRLVTKLMTLIATALCIGINAAVWFLVIKGIKVLRIYMSRRSAVPGKLGDFHHVYSMWVSTSAKLLS
jgi:hypothetical protein